MKLSKSFSLAYDFEKNSFKGKLGGKYISIKGGELDALGYELNLNAHAEIRLNIDFVDGGFNWSVSGRAKGWNFVTKWFDTTAASGSFRFDLRNSVRHNGILAPVFDRIHNPNLMCPGGCGI